MIRKIDYPRAQALWLKINRASINIKGMTVFITKLYERYESGFEYEVHKTSHIRVGQAYSISDIYYDGVVLDRRYVVPFFILKLVK
jgi:hypothetical protein